MEKARLKKWEPISSLYKAKKADTARWMQNQIQKQPNNKMVFKSTQQTVTNKWFPTWWPTILASGFFSSDGFHKNKVKSSDPDTIRSL